MVGSSGGAVSMVNEHGFSLSRNTGMQTKQVQVIKCKACGEILSEEHNYHYTAEELAELKALRKWSVGPQIFRGIMMFLILFCGAGSVFCFCFGFSDNGGTEAQIKFFAASGFFAGMTWLTVSRFGKL